MSELTKKKQNHHVSFEHQSLPMIVLVCLYLHFSSSIEFTNTLHFVSTLVLEQNFNKVAMLALDCDGTIFGIGVI